LTDLFFVLDNCFLPFFDLAHRFKDAVESMDAFFYFHRGVWPQLLRNAEHYLRLKRFAENMNHASFVAVIRLILNDAVLENGIRKGISGNLTQQPVVILGPHFKPYLHT